MSEEKSAGPFLLSQNLKRRSEFGVGTGAFVAQSTGYLAVKTIVGVNLTESNEMSAKARLAGSTVAGGGAHAEWVLVGS